MMWMVDEKRVPSCQPERFCRSWQKHEETNKNAARWAAFLADELV
jgi:hypothetical protein